MVQSFRFDAGPARAFSRLFAAAIRYKNTRSCYGAFSGKRHLLHSCVAQFGNFLSQTLPFHFPLCRVRSVPNPGRFFTCRFSSFFNISKTCTSLKALEVYQLSNCYINIQQNCLYNAVMTYEKNCRKVLNRT